MNLVFLFVGCISFPKSCEILVFWFNDFCGVFLAELYKFGDKFSCKCLFDAIDTVFYRKSILSFGLRQITSAALVVSRISSAC